MLQLCRTCHSEITTNDFIAIHDNNVKSTSVKSQLLSCVPELQLYLLKDPVLCAVCIGALSSAYSFKTQCLQTEERIRNYFLNTKLSEKSITLMDLYKQVTKATAVRNSLDLEDTVAKASNIVAGNNADAENDDKNFVLYQELPIFKEEISDTNKERTNCLRNLSENTDNIGSEDVRNVAVLASGDIEAIVKVEHNITQFKVEDDNELENLPLLDESLQRTQQQLKESEECFVKVDVCEDLAQLHLENALKSNTSCLIPKNQFETTEPDATINAMCREGLLMETSVSNVEIHSAEKPYKCAVCEFHTSLRRSLIQHMLTHTDEKPFRCTICQFRSVRKGNLQRHMRKHTGEKPFQCNTCEFRCANRSSLIQHRRTHTGEKPFQCNVCEYRTAQRANLITHMRYHTGKKPFQCTVCEYRATKTFNLKMHMLTHTGEKPYQCNICEFSTVLKQSLTQHMRTHTGEKPFVCSICDFSAAQQVNLNRHMKSHTGEKPFLCSLCEFRSVTKQSLTRHIRTHTGEKPFVCSMCDFRAAQQISLTRHLRTHTGEKPFLCSVCEFRTISKQSLTRHMRTHGK